MKADVQLLKEFSHRMDRFMRTVTAKLRQNKKLEIENQRTLQHHGKLLERVISLLEQRTPGENPQGLTPSTESRFEDNNRTVNQFILFRF